MKKKFIRWADVYVVCVLVLFRNKIHLCILNMHMFRGIILSFIVFTSCPVCSWFALEVKCDTSYMSIVRMVTRRLEALWNR